MKKFKTSGTRSALRAVSMAEKWGKVFGLCMLCAMAFSAIAAQGASAKGLTAWTCVAGTGFSTEHCVPGQTGTSFGHVEIPVSEVTHAKLSNDKTNATTTGPEPTIFKETIAATNFELEAMGAIEGLGTLKNELVGTEMRGSAESDANGITYNGVVVKAPAGKGCKVFEDNGGVKGAKEVIKTKPVKGHTTTLKERFIEGEKEIIEPVDSVIIEPATGATFSTFFIECEPGKVPAELEGTWEISGVLTCPTNGATIVCNHTTVTETKSLKGKGAKAGLFGKVTITAGKEPVTEPTHPISVTTE